MKLLLLSVAFALVDAKSYLATVHNFSRYPGYSGPLEVAGSVNIGLDSGTTYSFGVSLQGNASSNYSFHVHVGVSCEKHASVGGHFWAPFNSTDPWNAPELTFTTDSQGAATPTLLVDLGYTHDHFIGHAVVVHAADNTRIACGLIGRGDQSEIPLHKSSALSKYPGYSGSLNATGVVEVWDSLNSVNNETVVNFRLVGLAPNSVGGVHIHVGKTCATSGGHYWTPASATDPWLTTTYLSNSNGNADGSFIISSGYQLADYVQHAVVIHSSDNTRIACGTLGSTLIGTVSKLLKYPGYSGSLNSVNGSVAIYQSETDSNYRFVVNLANGETSALMAFHIHAGITCENASLVGGHFWKNFTDVDPWNTPKIASDSLGNVADAWFDLSFGYTHEEFLGHAVVIHDSANVRIACGQISDLAGKLPVYERAVLTRYPGYNGTLNTSGEIEVRDLDDKRQVVNFRLKGLPANASGGVHIHVGTTCNTSGDHYWTPASAVDPWLDKFYESAANGVAEGSFIVSSGYLLAQNKHHALVVHDVDKTRIACGLLGGAAPTPAPNSTAPTTVNGAAAASSLIAIVIPFFFLF